MREQSRVIRSSAMISVALVTTASFPILSSTVHAQEYSFAKVADSAVDGFDPFNFGCTTMNNSGAIAFRAGRVAADGFNTVDGIYRVNVDGTLTTIVENERFAFVGFNPSMNDRGQVSFAATSETRKGDSAEAILRGSGGKLTVIAKTRNSPFNFFGFDTSVNNDGRVAFKAELDEEFEFDEGLFSGEGKKVTVHYLASTSQFDGTDSRPSINNPGNIAFEESVDFVNGIFVTAANGFETIAAPDPDRSVEVPVLNDAGTTAFVISFVDDQTQAFVSEIVTGNGEGLTTVADTRGEFESFGFRPPSLNNVGGVGFHATLDDFTTSGVFAGNDPVGDRVVATGDTLGGATVQNLVFCEESLNDSGQLAFIATLEAMHLPEGFRTAVFRATPAAAAN